MQRGRNFPQIIERICAPDWRHERVQPVRCKIVLSHSSNLSPNWVTMDLGEIDAEVDVPNLEVSYPFEFDWLGLHYTGRFYTKAAPDRPYTRGHLYFTHGATIAHRSDEGVTPLDGWPGVAGVFSLPTVEPDNNTNISPVALSVFAKRYH